MITMETIRQLTERCDSTEKLIEGAEWADKKLKGWDPYYRELIGCWFLLRSEKIERSRPQSIEAGINGSEPL